jgi:FkbM family methyltransferase
LIQRIGHFVSRLPRRLTSGLRFRVFYWRESRFATPKAVRIGGRTIELQFPREAGVSADFLECIILNEYGLGDDLGEVKTILDLSANLGFFSLAARAYYPEALIHAYEPNPRTTPYLRRNTAQANIEIYEEAVGATSGQVRILDEGACNAARTGEATGSDGTVPRTSMKTAVERMGSRVDLLKLDVEGDEWNLFQSDQCWRGVRNVRMEYHLYQNESAQQAIEALLRLGFAIRRVEKKDAQMGIIWAAKPA